MSRRRSRVYDGKPESPGSPGGSRVVGKQQIRLEIVTQGKWRRRRKLSRDCSRRKALTLARSAGRRATAREHSVSEKTPDDIFRLAKDEDIEYVDVRFCDLPGTMQHFTIPVYPDFRRS